jgi:hypothetical protein
VLSDHSVHLETTFGFISELNITAYTDTEPAWP